MVNIDLPLYEKKTSVLNFSMRLVYTGAGGIKANECTNITGRGWLLRAGGTIVKHTISIPDENTPAFITTRASVFYAGLNSILS